jgi:hypothetical protein
MKKIEQGVVELVNQEDDKKKGENMSDEQIVER